MNALPSLRRRATALLVATLLLAGAGVLPVCGGFCCASGDDESMHAQMPCCETPSSLAPMDAVRVPPATVTAGIALQPPALPPVTMLVPVPPARAAFDRTSDAHHEPSPPLFLLNAQLLI